MANIFIQESLVNVTKGCRCGESEVFESCADTVGKLYRSCVKEYGRCTGRVYVDNDGKKAVGWVFVKRQKYEDCNDTFLAETWVTLHTQPPTKTVTPHYRYLNCRIP